MEPALRVDDREVDRLAARDGIQDLGQRGMRPDRGLVDLHHVPDREGLEQVVGRDIAPGLARAGHRQSHRRRAQHLEQQRRRCDHRHHRRRDLRLGGETVRCQYRQPDRNPGLRQQAPAQVLPDDRLGPGDADAEPHSGHLAGGPTHDVQHGHQPDQPGQLAQMQVCADQHEEQHVDRWGEPLYRIEYLLAALAGDVGEHRTEHHRREDQVDPDRLGDAYQQHDAAEGERQHQLPLADVPVDEPESDRHRRAGDNRPEQFVERAADHPDDVEPAAFDHHPGNGRREPVQQQCESVIQRHDRQDHRRQHPERPVLPEHVDGRCRGRRRRDRPEDQCQRPVAGHQADQQSHDDECPDALGEQDDDRLLAVLPEDTELEFPPDLEADDAERQQAQWCQACDRRLVDDPQTGAAQA